MVDKSARWTGHTLDGGPGGHFEVDTTAPLTYWNTDTDLMLVDTTPPPPVGCGSSPVNETLSGTGFQNIDSPERFPIPNDSTTLTFPYTLTGTGNSGSQRVRYTFYLASGAVQQALSSNPGAGLSVSGTILDTSVRTHVAAGATQFGFGYGANGAIGGEAWTRHLTGTWTLTGCTNPSAEEQVEPQITYPGVLWTGSGGVFHT